MTKPRAASGLLGKLKTPSMAHWLHLTEQPAPRRAGELRATFLGVSTILLDDGQTAVLTDGYFSRLNFISLMVGKIGPNRRRIATALAHAGITRLDAVFVVHSHFDHALDSALVADLTGARLIGSTSTRNIARGSSFPGDRFHVPVLGEAMTFGGFRITALSARHSPGDIAPGHIDQPLAAPAAGKAYKTGECYSLHISHHDRTLLIHASANFVPGALEGYEAETVYLGIATLAKQSSEFQEQYWREIVTTTGARRVVPIHWDNFTRPLDKPLRPLPMAIDDFPATMAFLRQSADRDGVTLALPVPWQPTWPFNSPGFTGS